MEQASLFREQTNAHPVVLPTTAAPLPQLVERRADYSWLATTLWKRVQALKRYPLQAVEDRAEGDVLLAAVVHSTGEITDIKVIESSGYLLLDQAAVEAVRKASPLTLFRPLDHDQVAVEIPISFHDQK